VPSLTEPGVTERVSLLSLVQEIVQEKSTALLEKNLGIAVAAPEVVTEFSSDAFYLFSEVNIANMKRALSNVIQNALEACAGRGRKVVVRLYQDAGTNVISVQDNGIGISEENLAHVTEKGFSSGKQGGSGLGLYYTKRDIEAWGGTLQIESKEGAGTTVRINLPAAQPPSWYRSAIEIPRGADVVILDDQEASRLTLRERIESALGAEAARGRIQSFIAPEELLNWRSMNPDRARAAVYLLDYDLGSDQQTGLEIAEELGLASHAILISGHYDLLEVQQHCERLGVGLIPKSATAELTIRYE
jgi:anti-sigma regulatory factor (Ser/Thr protein kinase)